MPCVCQQAFFTRVSVIVLTTWLFISRSSGSACGESDSDVVCGVPFSLLFVHFLCGDCDDVVLCADMHEINAELFPCRNVRRLTVALK